MADNDFRLHHGRAGQARDEVNSPAREGPTDPLAELARLIGQTDPHVEGGRYESDAAASGRDRPADDRYADQYSRAQNRYVQPPPLPPSPADPYPAHAPQHSGYENEPAASSRYFSGSAATFNGFGEDGRDYPAVDDAEDRREPTPFSPGRQLPAFAAAPPEDGYESDVEARDSDQAYDADDYHDETSIPRRGGLVVVMAVLGLAVIGTAGAFGYRAMFGSSVLPTLPPIIKASNGPNKIMPGYGDAQANNSSQAGAAGTGSAENLVTREEQPVKLEPPNAAPRVVSTLPISPGQSPAPAAPAAPAPIAGAPATASPGGAAPASVATLAPAPISSEPKKVHTVTIRADQSNGLGTAPVPPAATARGTVRPAAPAPKPSTTASAPAGPNAPLSIVPGAGGNSSAPARTRAAAASAPGAPTAVASATPVTGISASPSAGGGYAVQLTSQRSEADAQAAFRSLQAKYPNQLGGREPILRRADLGAKGVYYRALVGPFASKEEAAGMCSSLKAAGGDCNVQKN
jgi:SPOR domain